MEKIGSGFFAGGWAVAWGIVIRWNGDWRLCRAPGWMGCGREGAVIRPIAAADPVY